MMDAKDVDDAIEFIRGITFKPNQLIDLSDEDAVVCMRTKNVQHELDESDLIAVPNFLVRRSEKYLRSGDTLISSANSLKLVGKCCYVEELGYPATAGGFISIVRPKQGKTHPRFLYHWLNSPRTQHTIRNLGRQTTNISNLDVGRFKQLDFPKIDLEGQARIATILDKADCIRRKREDAIAMADKLLRSVFLEMFGDPVVNPKAWPIFKLGECVEEVRYGTSAKCTDDRGDGLPVLRIPNIVGGGVIWKDLKYTTLSGKEIEKLRMKNEDVVFVRTNGNPDYIARCAVYESDRDCLFASYLIRARFGEASKLMPRYVWMALSVPSYRSVLLRETKTTAGNYNISGSGLKSLRVPTPPLAVQREFERFYEHLSDYISSMTAALKDAESLFGSLSQRAFRGEL